jgi:FMN phosphatase YigB (HAD superfamily)
VAAAAVDKVAVVMRLARRVLLVLLLVLVAGACQVDADVLIEMDEDGGGAVTVTVTLDPEAAARVPDLAEQLRVDDLEAAGWAVDGPSTVEGGAVEIRATKRFATPEEGAAVLEEVGGASGLFTDVALSEEASFARTTYRFSATADASGGVAALADDDLVAVLDGDGFGGQLERIEAETGAPADEQVSLEVRAQLPGATQSWTVEPGAPPTELTLEHEEIRPVPVLLVGAAVACFVVGVALLIVRIVGSRRRRRADRAAAAAAAGDVGPEVEEVPEGAVQRDEIPWSTAAVAEDDATGVPEAAAAAAAGDADDAPASRRLQLVVIDVMGVGYATGRATPDLLADFVHQRGSTIERHALETTWGLAAEGRLTVGELWASLGLTGDPGDLSDEFLTLHRLRPGVRQFLERMVARDLPVAGVADDVAEWSRKLRSTHKLDHLTRAWIVSGDVGERLPGGALLGRVIQVTGIEARNSLFISDRVANLDAARSFGFAGALVAFDGPPDDAAAAAGYPVITSLDELAP